MGKAEMGLEGDRPKTLTEERAKEPRIRSNGLFKTQHNCQYHPAFKAAPEPLTLVGFDSPYSILIKTFLQNCCIYTEIMINIY